MFGRSKGKSNLNVSSALHRSSGILHQQRNTGISDVSVTNDNLHSATSNVVLGALGTVLGGVILYLILRSKLV